VRSDAEGTCDTEGFEMKAGMKTALRTAAWSTSALLLTAAAVGTAGAVTAHQHATANASGGDSSGSSARPQLLHDLATVENSDGTFGQYAGQFGTVSSVSDVSITVVSADKYSATYVVDASTHVMKNGNKAAIGDVAKGDTVFVRAEDQNGTFTAELIGDGKPPARGPGGHRPPPPGGPDGGPAPDGGGDGS
jgi:hypothetical protein